MLIAATAAAQAPLTSRINVSSDGAEAIVTTGAVAVSVAGSISADGRYVAFTSVASLTPGDPNGHVDVFVRDVPRGKITRITGTGTGSPALLGSQPAMSADGRYVAFEGWRTPGPESVPEIFVCDLQSGITDRVSVASDGSVPALDGASITPAISGDGRFVAFASALRLVAQDTNGVYDVFVRDLQTHQTVRASVASNLSQANGNSFHPAISLDGRYVAFHSAATNLVDGDTNDVDDVFVHDRQTGQTSRVSVASDGSQSAGPSMNAAISADGDLVAFQSFAANLVTTPSLAGEDVFVHQRQTHRTTRVSMASDGTTGNNVSYIQSISADGRWIAFQSYATNLVPGDTNGTLDMFVHDRAYGRTKRVSVGSDGSQATGGSLNTMLSSPVISGNGRYVLFDSDATNLVTGDTNGLRDVFLHDQQTGETVRVSVGAGHAEADGTYNALTSMSGDGRYVAFEADATNLVAGGSSGPRQVYLRDRKSGVTARVSVAPDRSPGNGVSGNGAVSAKGRHIAFESGATNLVGSDTNGLVDVFVYDQQTGQAERVSVASNGAQSIGGDSAFPAISADGRFIAFESTAANLVAGDTNAASDIFVHDRRTHRTTRVSITNAGAQGDMFSDSHSPAISGDGRYVVFESLALNLVPGLTVTTAQIYVRDRLTGRTTCVSVANDGTAGNIFSDEPSISEDGRYVTFRSHATNLVPRDTNGAPDVFVHDRVTRTTTRASIASGGIEANGVSGRPKISGDGRLVAYYSVATNLVPGDTNGAADVFVWNRLTRTTTRVSVANNGSQSVGMSSFPAISRDGRYVAFASTADNLVAHDTNQAMDIFLRDQRGTVPP